MKQGVIFASARAKAKEVNLFAQERLYRMTECKTVGDAVRIMSESSYGEGANLTTENFHEALCDEERKATDFLREAAPRGIGIECFFLRNDYHNLKVLVKAKYGGIDEYSDKLLPEGLHKVSELKERCESGRLGFMNSHMGEALDRIEREAEASGGASPRRIDVELDKAMYREIVATLKGKHADKYVREYFATSIDLANIGALLRTIAIGAKFAFFEDNFIEGGEIELYSLKACGTDWAKLKKFVESTKYRDIFSRAEEGDLSAFETAKDELLLSIFSANKGDMFSVAPIVGYYLGKLNEVKDLRVVLVCIKNGTDKETMLKRVRKLYA